MSTDGGTRTRDFCAGLLGEVFEVTTSEGAASVVLNEVFDVESRDIELDLPLML